MLQCWVSVYNMCFGLSATWKTGMSVASLYLPGLSNEPVDPCPFKTTPAKAKSNRNSVCFLPSTTAFLDSLEAFQVGFNELP